MTSSFNVISLIAWKNAFADANDAKVHKIFEDGCEKGGNAGCNELGVEQAEKKNWDVALKLFQKACAEGAYPNGCNNLGTLEFRLGLKADARKHFRMSCDSGDGRGCFKLGNLEVELGNYKDARRYLNQSCDIGENDGCNLLATLTKRGR